MPEEIDLKESGIEPPTENKVQDTIEPYRDNLEYLADHFERIKLLKDIQRLRKSENSRSATEKKQKEEELKGLENRIMERLNVSTRAFPLEEFKKQKALSKNEELIVIALLEKEVSRSGHFHIEELLDLISQTQYEKLLNRKLLQEDGRLIRDQIIETDILPLTLRNSTVEYARLNENLRIKLLEEKKKKKKKKRKITSFKGEDLFEVIKPSIPLDKVILHHETSEKVATAIGMAQGTAADLLYKWGIRGNLLSPASTSSRKRNYHSVTLLFYGPPGTGKTLTANSVGYFLKRKLITLDCSKILGSWVGESEKNTRKIFDRYREISKGDKKSPVLLLNEADQFLQRRMNAERSTDHMYNQMQNIFLEQLERFKGILIATTNLVENLDPAFSRRFLHKIEFKRPGPEERFKLWRVIIPEKVPLSADIDLLYLSTHYDLSGGQISVVVRNAITRAAMRGDRLFMADLITACADEINGNFDEKAKGSIGFRERTLIKTMFNK